MSDSDIVKDALDRFNESQSGSDINRQEAEEDIRFARLGDQWPAEVKKLREAEGRPCLTINRSLSFIRQIVNEARQNTPSIKVSPADDAADIPTANVINGLIRKIQNGRRKADIAYDTAIEHAISGGFGFFRIGIDYVDADSFDMELFIDRVPNPLMVHWDVSSTEFDSSDWEYGFISDFLTPETFKKRYPDAAPVSFEGMNNDLLSYWFDDERIRVAEYFLRDERKRTVYQLSDGRTVRKDQLPEIAKAFFAQGGIEISDDDEAISGFMQVNGLEFRRQREATYYEVTHRVLNGIEVLDESPWPGSTIPICPVWGDEVIIDGRRHFRSLIRDARDPQAMFNFWRSASTELVALAPRAPWVGPKGFIPNTETDRAKWESANTRSHAYLEFDATKGAAPQRQPFAGVPAGALQEALNAADDMKSITGIYDSALGAQSNETSGRAILARQRQSNTSNYHFLDNLNRAIEGAGRILVETIPAVYSDRQTIRILGEDKAQEVIHLTSQAGGPQQEGIDGPELYNISVGKYDVSVGVGVDYATSRQETSEVLMELMRQVPGAAQYIGDIAVEVMDFPQAEKVAQRLKLLLPPQVQQMEGITPPPMPGQMPGQNPMIPQQPEQPV